MGNWLGLIISGSVVAGVLVAGLLVVMRMPGETYTGSFLPLTKTEKTVQDRLQQHVYNLAGRIGERNIWHYASLVAAATYLDEELRTLGYEVKTQAYPTMELTVKNLEAELTGVSQPEETIIVGAHYDSVLGSPGANDNGSGVAALLEIAHLLADQKLPRTVRFVAFANEEPPFFYTEAMGSRVYARRSRHRGEHIVAMLSLECFGYYSEEPGSQRYPFPFGLFYPEVGNFIGFVGNLSSRTLVREAVATFRRQTPFPSEGTAAPGWLTGIHWSDHWAFWKEGYPAIMVTDTALFRYGHYHASTDTPDKLDYPRLARVTVGIASVITELAGSALIDK